MVRKVSLFIFPVLKATGITLISDCCHCRQKTDGFNIPVFAVLVFAVLITVLSCTLKPLTNLYTPVGYAFSKHTDPGMFLFKG